MIGVVAVQGAFLEHEKRLAQLGADCFEIRKKEDLQRDFSGLILPGGESTVQGKLLRELDLMEPLRRRILEGLPVLATCAGLILLAKRLENSAETHLATLPVTVRRNAYGRQLGSFHTVADCLGLGPLPMTFIRAPYVTKAGPGVQVLARVEGCVVAVRYGNQLGVAFHPELDENTLLHQWFLTLIAAAGAA